MANVSLCETSYARDAVRPHPISIRQPSYTKPFARDNSPSARPLQQVRRTLDPATTPIEHVGVNHRRTDVFVPESYLHGPDVVPRFEQMRGTRVPKRIFYVFCSGILPDGHGDRRLIVVV